MRPSHLMSSRLRSTRIHCPAMGIAIFSCGSPDDYRTVSRSQASSSSSFRPAAHRAGNGPSPRSAGRPSSQSSPRVQAQQDPAQLLPVSSTSARPSSSNGQAPVRALSSRDLSKRNGVKLQKRPRCEQILARQGCILHRAHQN